MMGHRAGVSSRTRANMSVSAWRSSRRLTATAFTLAPAVHKACTTASWPSRLATNRGDRCSACNTRSGASSELAGANVTIPATLEPHAHPFGSPPRLLPPAAPRRLRVRLHKLQLGRWRHAHTRAPLRVPAKQRKPPNSAEVLQNVVKVALAAWPKQKVTLPLAAA